MEPYIAALVIFTCPYVRVSNLGEEERIWSGVVIAETESNYMVLTCAHGVEGISPENRSIQVDFVNFQSYKYTSVPSKVMKVDFTKDLMLVACPKYPAVHVKPVPVSDEELSEDDQVEIYGFVMRSKVKKSVHKLLEYEITDLDGTRLLGLNGPATNGFSGGPVVKDNKVHGIQSAGGKTRVTCASLTQIWDFLDEEHGRIN